MALGGEPRHLGHVGAALHTKLALNQLIASLTHSFSLALHAVQQAGVEVETFMAILRESALYAPTLDKKLAKELADDPSTKREKRKNRNDINRTKVS
ncbi:hypothetical protein [Synechococcus sp. CBW1108]|uniref:hypothetical protein n=1 Tax=Synechococcus sp. CBW1108 TaxID=1353147 RepID=UPI001E361845|nr:hypothetical protein [Synechococcus sp. CBW1108]